MDTEVRDRLREFEGVGECLVLYKYEWPAVLGLAGGSRTYWAHVRYVEPDGDWDAELGRQHIPGHWVEISAEDEIDLDNVLAVAPLPEVTRGA